MKSIFYLVSLSVLLIGCLVFADDAGDEVLEVLIGIDDGQAADEDATEAPPTTATPTGRKTWRRGGHGGHRRGGKKEWTHRSQPMTFEEKMTFVCRRIQSNSSDEPHHGMSWKLRRMEPEKREQIMEMWRQKRAEMAPCCAKEGAERLTCAEGVKARRFDRACNNEEPLYSFKRKHGTQNVMTDIITKCCPLQGQDRYKCFDESKRTAWEGIRARKMEKMGRRRM